MNLTWTFESAMEAGQFNVAAPTVHEAVTYSRGLARPETAHTIWRRLRGESFVAAGAAGNL